MVPEQQQSGSDMRATHLIAFGLLAAAATAALA